MEFPNWKILSCKFLSVGEAHEILIVRMCDGKRGLTTSGSIEVVHVMDCNMSDPRGVH